MYKVLLDGALMCDSRIEELALIDPVINLEENKAGSFSFTIPPGHPSYDTIQKRKTIVEVYLDDDDEPIFSGECIEATEDFYKQKKIYCEGAFAFLNDSIQRPKQYKGYTVRGLLEAFIANHNAQTEERKHFQVGIVTVTDPNNYITCYTNMESTMTCLKEDLVDDLGGIIRVRYTNGIRYIDYLAESPNTNSQVIKFGKNLMDFTSNIDSSEIATAIIPLGATQEQTTVEGLETRLTIESVNNGLDYVYSADAVEAYGWIYKAVEFDNITTASALKTKGEQYLAETQFENMVIEAKAIDLHLINSATERFKISDQIRVVSAPHGLNKYIRLTKQTINLNNRENDEITLGKDENVPLSAKANQADTEIKKAIANIVPPNTILNDAKENASALITEAMGGYVYKTNDALYIMDTNNPDTATRVWRWNINGLGYSSTGINGEYGLAMTMDGAIVADFITTGMLNSVYINNGNGNFTVDRDGNVVANSLSSNNANITGGSLKIKRSEFEWDVLVLESDNYLINFTSNAMEMYSYLDNSFMDFSPSGIFVGTFTGKPHSTGFIKSYTSSYYGEFANIKGLLRAMGGAEVTGGLVVHNSILLKSGGMTVTGGANIDALYVSGSKSRKAATEDYGERLLYCYETPSPMFGDLGEGRIDETGKCYVFLDDIFAETIDTDCAYQVFLQAYGNGNCYVTERTSNYFVVEGTENMAFGWEVKAIQKDYDTMRLEEYTEPMQDDTEEILNETSDYLNALLNMERRESNDE